MWFSALTTDLERTPEVENMLQGLDETQRGRADKFVHLVSIQDPVWIVAVVCIVYLYLNCIPEASHACVSC